MRVPWKVPQLLIIILFLVLCGCQRKSTVCEEGSGTTKLPFNALLELEKAEIPELSPKPATVQLGGKSIQVDKLVEGPLCNESWSGTIYVGCEIQVAEWGDDPMFFKDCDFSIAPGTIVYVAAHNNAPYYQGCSCHTGEVMSE